MSVNKVIILGNVGKAPEIRKTNSPTVANLTVATSERWTDRNGEKLERTEWHNVTAFGKTAEFVEKFIVKGSSVYVEGKIRTESYEKNGETKYITRIYADSLQIVSGKRDDQPRPERSERAPQPAPVEDSLDPAENPDDLPF